MMKHLQEENVDVVECSIKLNSVLLSTASGPTRKDAKDKASEAALTQLKRQCYTIMVRNRFTSGDGTTVNANTLELSGKTNSCQRWSATLFN